MNSRLIVFCLISLHMAWVACIETCRFPEHSDEAKTLQVLENNTLMGEVFSTTNGEYNFTVGICRNVNDAATDSCDSATQTRLKDGVRFVLGRCSNTDLHAGGDWIFLTYEEGENYAHACGQQPRKTIIMMSCDCNATEEGDLSFSQEDLDRNNGSCYYMFEIKTTRLCENNCSALVMPSLNPAHIDSLSGGSIFVIIFSAVLGTYLVAGILFKYCTGHYGIELIPNVYFWMNFFNLVADGCEFVFRCGPYADKSALRIDDDFATRSHGSMASSQRRGPLTPPPSALPPTTPSDGSYQNTLRSQRPTSTNGSMTGEAGSLASTSDDAYLIQA